MKCLKWILLPLVLIIGLFIVLLVGLISFREEKEAIKRFENEN